MLLRSSLLLPFGLVLLSAQGFGGGGHHHGGGVTQATPPVGPPPIGLQPQASGFTGLNNPRVTLPPPIGLQPLAAGFTGINPGALRTHPYNRPQPAARGNGGDHDRRGRAGYGLPYYPVIGYGTNWYDPSGYAPVGLQDDSAAQTDQVTANLLGEQIQRLTAEVESLRNNSSNYAPMATVPQAPEEPADLKPIVLVLRSGKTLEVQNYAIMNGVLWDFTKQNSRRIPLSTVDGPASEKATEQAGGSFPEASFGVNPN